MSTIRVDNFGPSAGGTTYSARGISKCWVNFNGTGTIAARDSENVSSLTDNGTGDYTVNFSNAFGAADYSGVFSVSFDVSAAPNAGYVSNGYPASSSSFRSGITGSQSLNYLDVEYVGLSAFGDLA